MKRIRKAIISPNRAIASVRAKPRMVRRNRRCSSEGLRDTPITKAPNTVPIPAPAPPTEIVAAPAPIKFCCLYDHIVNFIQQKKK